MYASPLKEQVFNDNLNIADSMLEQALQEWKAPKGEVYLVGAGPGDPELLTLKALRLMQQADVVIYDRLVSQPILELCRRDSTKIYVGKARSNHSVPQDGINALLVEYAQQGKRVCRLKAVIRLFLGVVAKRSKNCSKLVYHFRWFQALRQRQAVQLMLVFRSLIVIMRRVYVF